MYEVRCPSCRLRLWLYQGMGRDVPPPERCPACHVSRPIDHTDVVAARLAARVDRERRAQIAAHERDADPICWAPLRPRDGR